ncbi:MAG: fatty acid desaturase, partial [Geminicoccaceae bacterium]
HHHFEQLTDPYRDPESYYIDQQSWVTLPAIIQRLMIWHHTLLGRMILGPFLAIGQFLRSEVRALVRGDHQNLNAWLWHIPGVALVLLWVVGVCGMSIWGYVLMFVIPGTSLTLVRSFAEHKAANSAYERTAIVEAGRFFSLLYLNNNLHFAHHRRPDLPWQALPDYYRSHRRDLLKENGGLCYQQGYWEIAKRFFLKPVDQTAHPFI